MTTPSVVRIGNARLTGRNSASSETVTWAGSVAPPDGAKCYMPVLSSAAVNTPSGWSIERGPTSFGAHTFTMFEKTASSEPSSYTVTFASACQFAFTTFAVQDVVSVTTGSTTTGTGDPVGASITVPASTLVIGVWGGDNQSASANVVYTPPAGFSDVIVPIIGRGSAGTYLSFAIASQVMSGATGTQTADSHSSTGAAIGFLLGFTGTALTRGLVVGSMTLN